MSDVSDMPDVSGASGHRGSPGVLPLRAPDILAYATAQDPGQARDRLTLLQAAGLPRGRAVLFGETVEKSRGGVRVRNPEAGYPAEAVLRRNMALRAETYTAQARLIAETAALAGLRDLLDDPQTAGADGIVLLRAADHMAPVRALWRRGSWPGRPDPWAVGPGDPDAPADPPFRSVGGRTGAQSILFGPADPALRPLVAAALDLYDSGAVLALGDRTLEGILALAWTGLRRSLD